MKITRKGCKNKHEIVTEILGKKKKTKIENAEETKIWDKIRNNIKKGFDREAVYDEKYLKTKIKFYGDKIHIFRIMECLKVAPVFVCQLC